jgi:ornithine cyclodeaminase/alanine dehydrogenase-like protein (mu-crystallin family)
MAEAIDALDRAFARTTDTVAPQRSHIEIDDGSLLLMPAAGPSGAGVKLVTVNPANPERGLPLINGVYVLFEPGTLVPIAVFDGAALTGLRTAAVSGLATRYAARPDSHQLVIFGAGVQAATHLDAMVEVLPIRTVRVVSRTRARAEQLVDRARRRGLDAATGGPDSVADADVVCTCTTSNEPLFDGTLLKPGTHINAIGAFEPHARELDDATVRGARIVVEERSAAFEEAGDLILPMRSGAITTDQIVADLSEVVGGTEVRGDLEDITVFKSVGLALEDLAVASAAAQHF